MDCTRGSKNQQIQNNFINNQLIMNQQELVATLRQRDEEIFRLRGQLQLKNSSNYEQKYKKALKSIEEIIKANKQIKQELDALRTIRQAENHSMAIIQKEQFQKSYDGLLKEKNGLVLQVQSLELENQKLRYEVGELQNQIQLYKQEKYHRVEVKEAVNLQTEVTQGPETLTIGINSNNASPKRQTKDNSSQLWKQKQKEMQKTLLTYEDHIANLTRMNKEHEKRMHQLENKLISSQKNWRNVIDTKELDLIDTKSQIRQEFNEQVSALRKENAKLKMDYSQALTMLENQKSSGGVIVPQQKFDWEAQLVQEMVSVKANLEPLRQQISELQDMNIYEKEQSLRERTNLRTQVLELESQVQRQIQTIKSLEKKLLDSHQEKVSMNQKAVLLKQLEEENKLLNGKIIVMESRQIALKNRTGQQLQERVLQFQSRIQLLLSNKENLKELKEVNIHQLLALKAYIMELDNKIKELVSSNSYLTKKYKSYKEKYQGSLKQYKNYNSTINNLKIKILGYDKLVLKLQEELEYYIRTTEIEVQAVNTRPVYDQNAELYKKKYEMMKEKLQLQEKYKAQEIQTLKLNYDTKIMELNIQIDDLVSVRQTLELYKNKNEELQQILNKKESELYQSKMGNTLKGSAVSTEQVGNIKQTKDIMNNLHVTIKHNDETIFKLQSEMRSKQENYKRVINQLERDIAEVKEDFAREANKKQIERTLEYEQEVKKLKKKIADLEHQLHLLQISHQDKFNKKTDTFDTKLKQLELRVQEAEQQREDEIFSKRRLEKQNQNLLLDKEQLMQQVTDLENKFHNMKQLERENYDLRLQTTNITTTVQPDTSAFEYQLANKDNLIRKLKSQISQLQSNIADNDDRNITLTSLRNEIFYLKKENDDLNDTIGKYNNEITILKGHLDSSKNQFNSGLESMLEDKDNALTKLRKDGTAKDFKIQELEHELGNVQETLRKQKQMLSQIPYIKQQLQNSQELLSQKSTQIQRLRYELSTYEDDIDRYKKDLSSTKQANQKINYQIMEKDDQISSLTMEINNINMRNREAADNRFRDELEDKDRQINKVNAEYMSLKTTLSILEEDKNYHEDNYRRVNNQMFALRGQLNQLQDENTALSQQIYLKSQELSRMSIAAQSAELKDEDLMQKDAEISKLRSEIFSLRTSISSLEDEIYNKEASLSRLYKEINYIKDQYNQLEDEQKIKQETINRLNYEVNTLRKEGEERYQADEERNATIHRLKSDINNYKNKYNQLEEDIQERQQQFTNTGQEIARLKAELTYKQDEIDQKKNQVQRFITQRQNLRSEIVTLNEQITDKNLQNNKLKQDLFNIRMEINQDQYQTQFKTQQELMSFKSKITMLEHEVEDKQAEIRRLMIDLQTSRYKPNAVVNDVSEEELQELRNQVNKKQREIISLKFQLDDKVYQIQSGQNTINILKNQLSQLQINSDSDRGEYERVLREAAMKERRLNDQMDILKEEVDRLQRTSQKDIFKSYTITYSEEEMNQIQKRLNQKQAELIELKNQDHEKTYFMESQESKIQMQEKLIGQIESQANEDISRLEGEIQSYILKERQYRDSIAELQATYERQIQEMNSSHRENISTLSTQQQNQSANQYQNNVKTYLDQIDRLNTIIQELQQEVEEFKLKLSSMFNQENRLEENLVTMVLLFTQIQSLRERVKNKESQINEVRKSFIQMTVAGELESNKMSRILSLAKENQQSHERIDVESVQRSSISTPKSQEHQHIQQFSAVNMFKKEQAEAAAVDLAPKGFRKEEGGVYVHSQNVPVVYREERIIQQIKPVEVGPEETVGSERGNHIFGDVMQEEERITFQGGGQQVEVRQEYMQSRREVVEEERANQEEIQEQYQGYYQQGGYQGQIRQEYQQNEPQINQQEEVQVHQQEPYQQQINQQEITPAETKQKEQEHQQEIQREVIVTEQNVERKQNVVEHQVEVRQEIIQRREQRRIPEQIQVSTEQNQPVLANKGSFIMQIQKESPRVSQSQTVNRGQITIKIQNPPQVHTQTIMSRSLTTNEPSPVTYHPAHHSTVIPSAQAGQMRVVGGPQVYSTTQRQSHHIVREVVGQPIVGPSQVRPMPHHPMVEQAVRVSPGRVVSPHGVSPAGHRPSY